ncbi:DUF523 domain-containing protein [Gorillibacterium timonense]|uniref:DUF523 domain-containing protein n=1 Tax=Gorillibacterium timonense TaxID=1689269 RepID=UPI00071D367B|nr:DUF523 domain-containing protein [Gorillibacterium timonense]
MILVSSCLAGLKVRYNGLDSLDETIGRLVEEGRAIPVCPEVLGGCSTPREPAEIVGGSGEDVLNGIARIIDTTGSDVTDKFVQGAMETLRIAREAGATIVVLKESSPSCGSSRIYDGTHSGRKIPGMGVTAALLHREGITVLSENQLERVFKA